MQRTLTRSYGLSASYAKGGRVIGRNFILAVTIDAVGEDDELRLDELVIKNAIAPSHTRDWDQTPDFLRQCGREDHQLLDAFWRELSGPLATFRVRRLALRRDEHTCTTLEL